MIFAEKLLYLRKNNNMSQEELAEKLNVSRQAVSRWESGTALPDATNLLCISKLFNVSTDYLLYDEYTNAHNPSNNTDAEKIFIDKLKPKYFLYAWLIGYVITYIIYNRVFYFGTFNFSLAFMWPIALVFSKIYLWFIVIFAVIYFICYNSHKK